MIFDCEIYFLCFIQMSEISGNVEVVNQFIMESKTYKARQMFSIPLSMDNQRYNYYLRILNVQFSNVVPNVEVNQGINADGTDYTIVSPGIWKITNMIDEWNTLGIGELTWNDNTGLITLKNSTGSAIVYSNPGSGNNILSSDFFGFKNMTFPYTLNDGASITASQVGVVQKYNYFILSSGNVNGYTYISRDNKNGFLPSTCIYAFSSAMEAFQFKTWTAVQPIQFKLDGDKINHLDFEIRTGTDEEIKTLLAQSDFMITCQIVKEKKI